ncbi:NFACT family protein [Candidatus Woesearchaeota archaeon]|nr:NFACT family protein [Candidatus Woesearchaeota archaeon]
MEKIPKELSALDLYYLLKEFSILQNSKVENIYQKDNILILQLYIKGQGKRFLKISLPNFIYITSFKEEMPVKPQQFCTITRKYLRNAILQNIEQIGFERVLRIEFSKKDQSYFLICELFSNGNIILCNKDMKIIYPMTHQTWKDRIIKSGKDYIPPERKINIINDPNLSEELRKTMMDSIVTFLAKEVGFGGIYAEIICSEMGIPKESRPKEVDPYRLAKILKDLLDKDMKINSLLDKKLTERAILEEKEVKEKEHIENKSKTEKILEMQKATIEKQEQIIDECNKKGDLIYQNYNKVQTVIDAINKAKKEMTWTDIKKKLKDNNIIRSIDEKKGRLILKID